MRVLVLWLALCVGAAASECALASWYGPGFHGRLTASGTVYDRWAMTAAHRTLPFGTRLRVTYGGRSVVVVVTDRGPYVGRRALDLSQGAARQLGMERVGVARVCWVAAP